MSAIVKQVSLAAGANDDNILSGSAFEFLRRNAVVSIGILADVTGSFVTIQSGSDILLEESPTPVKAGFPQIPDDMYFNDVGVVGDRLVVRLRNPTAGAIVFTIITQITDL